MLVLKVGGGAGNDLEKFVEDIPGDEPVVIVHGGSDEMNVLSEELGHSPRFIASPSGHTSRLTDKSTIEILIMAYSGKVNKRLVEMLRRRGHNAIGLSGIDGGLLRGMRKGSIRSVDNGKVKMIRGDNTGKVENVNTKLLDSLLGDGYLPVITIPIEAEDGVPLNADCDRVAAAVASSMKADKLILLTNQPGLLRNPDDPTTLIREGEPSQIESVMEYAKGRMKKKVLAAREALDGGVPEVVISGSSVSDPVTSALRGEGTVIG